MDLIERNVRLTLRFLRSSGVLLTLPNWSSYPFLSTRKSLAECLGRTDNFCNTIHYVGWESGPWQVVTSPWGLDDPRRV